MHTKWYLSAGCGIALAASAFSGIGVAQDRLGPWTLATRGGASVCRIVLTGRPIPGLGTYEAFVRGGPQCTDWRVRTVRMWIVRGNLMHFNDHEGREIVKLGEQGPDQYAGADWVLHR
jgi:hypothetical protein